MTRHRRRLVLSSLSACLIVLLALVSAQGQQFPAQDPERGFALGDTNLDGKLSLDEFRDLLLSVARLKNAQAKATPAMIEPLFQRLDTNRDRSLSIAEYRRIGQMRPGGGGPRPFAKGGMLKKQAAPKQASPNTAKPAIRAVEARPISAEQTKFFESKIRPVLVAKCAKCHASNSDKIKGGLLVDSAEGLRKGGDTGPAVVPGNLDESLLITAIRFHDESLQMPPKAKLSDDVIADFETWIKMGAPDPRVSRGAKASTTTSSGIDLKKGRQFWAFQAPKAVTPPQVKDAGWPRTDIDRFVLASLEARGLKPVADADRPTWIRRVTFDLIGLPPTPEEIEAYVSDTSSDADAKVVDRLLGSLRFGERWGRHWLDVARYAESSGKVNMLYSQAWRYRDWVITAFNNDKPYDQFIREQIAGDLLPAPDEPTRASQVIATGFLAIGGKTHNTQNRQQFVLDVADEQIDATGQAFLGLTIACARCHDHKFDPIPQRDYYALSGIFQSTQTCYGTLPGLIQNLNPSPLIELPAEAYQPQAVPNLTPDRRKVLEEQVAELIKTRDSLTREELATPKAFQTRGRLAVLRFRLASYQEDGTPRTYAMGVRERFEPIDSPFYTRGELDQGGEPVPRGLLQVISKESKSPVLTKGSGRKELANWLASKENPLTARVMVNRVWLHLFGRALVTSPDNFGSAGQRPSHPELLDSLAVSFMDQGWSVKKLIRQIVLSRAYQLGSAHDPKNYEADPDNTLVWRMTRKRLEAEAIRDAVLAVSGKLNVTPPVGSAVAIASEGPVGPFRNLSQDAQEVHRAVYLPVVRDLLPDSLAVFDFADPSLVTGERSSTSGPTQSLFLMNSPFVIRQAEAAADRILEGSGSNESRVKTAYLRFLGRKPTAAETARALKFLGEFKPESPTGKTAVAGGRASCVAFCQALYASAEFRYVD